MAAQEEAPANVVPMLREDARRKATDTRAQNRLKLIESGDLVSNAPLRERCEWLMQHDPEFSLVQVCLRMADQGYPKFAKQPSRGRTGKVTGDTTHVLRLLGMRDRAPSFKRGKRYGSPYRSTHVPYDVAVALCRALEMDPVDAGV